MPHAGSPSRRGALFRRVAGVCLAALFCSAGGGRTPAGESAPPRGTILVLGDSLAAGSGVEKEQAFPAILQKRVDQANLPYDVVNAGVNGDTSSGGRRRIPWLLRRPVDVLLLELGGNDGLRGIPPETTRSNLIAIVEATRAKYPEARVLVAGMQMPANMGPAYTEEFREVFPAVARETQSALIPFLLEGVGADPQYNQPDLIHPNPAGHRRVADTVWKYLEPVLRETSEAEDRKGKTR